MTEVVVWTIVFLGGDLLVLLALIAAAARKDMQKARQDRSGE